MLGAPDRGGPSADNPQVHMHTPARKTVAIVSNGTQLSRTWIAAHGSVNSGTIAMVGRVNVATG